MQAIISGLQMTPAESHLRIVTDSSYCADGATRWHKKWIDRGWKGVANTDLWHTLLDEISRHKLVEFRIVKGHSRILWNDQCDTIAKTAAKARREMEEHGYTTRFDRLEARIQTGSLFDKDMAK